MPETQPVIEIVHLKKSFNSNKVLNDINLTVNKGENVVVLGKSGSGKSVLIKCVVRLIEPDSGTVKVLGKDVLGLRLEELNRLRQRTGFLFQGAALYDSMSVRENLAFPLKRQFKGSPAQMDELIEEALFNVGLLDVINKMPSELSGGMRKRIGLARTLILKPEIIFYDEPTTGLDAVTSREISNLIVELQKKYHTSSIIITHDMHCVRIASNRIAVLKDGIIIANGSYEELLASQDAFVKAFFE